MKKIKLLISSVLFIGLIVLIYSCQKEEVFPIEPETTAKSTTKSSNALIENAKNWYQANLDQNDYPLTVAMKELKWNNAVIHEQADMKIIEVSIKLKDHNKLGIRNKKELNVEPRMLFIFSEDKVYSLMEYIIASESNENLNINIINYGNRNVDFTGKFVYENISGKIVMEQFNNDSPNLKNSFKSADYSCLIHSWYYENKPDEIYYEYLWCIKKEPSGDIEIILPTGLGGEGGASSTDLPDSEDCSFPKCQNPGCNGYLFESLKIMPLEGEEIHVETEVSCPPCTCPEVIETPEFRNDSCLTKLLYQLWIELEDLDGSTYLTVPATLSNSILTTFGMSETVDVYFDVKDLNDAAVAGRTIPIIGTNDYLITINSTYSDNATDLTIAKTIIHEVIHANLLELFKDTSTTEYSELLNLFYTTGTPNVNTLHHDYFADNLIPGIANSIFEWAQRTNLNVSLEYCTMMAWGGLAETTEFQAKTDSNDILIAIINETNNNDEAKGRACN